MFSDLHFFIKQYILDEYIIFHLITGVKMKYGLFIGINQYINGITPLKCARNDALALSKVFALNGYKIHTLLDGEATASNIRKTLRNLSKQLNQDDFLLFYFSGHGCEVNKNHYLIGQAAFPDGIQEGEEVVALNRVRELTDIPGVRRLFMLDCCRNDLHGGKGMELCPESRGVALNRISNHQYNSADIIHPLIVTSCSTGERSYEDIESGRGYFTQILEKSLDDRKITSFPAFRKMLADGMRFLKQKQTLCWHGNVDAWDNFKLLDSWTSGQAREKTSPEKKQDTPKPQPLPPVEENPLTTDERLNFNDLLFKIDEICDSLGELPDSMKNIFAEIQKKKTELFKQEQNRKNLQAVQVLHAETEKLKTQLRVYQACDKMLRTIQTDKKILEEHGIALSAEFFSLEKKAIFAHNNEDYEVSFRFLEKVQVLIRSQRSSLEEQLKKIEDLKTAIQKTEKQLSCSSAQITGNSERLEKLLDAEKRMDYKLLQQLLEEVLENNQLQIKKIENLKKSISKLKSKAGSLEEKFSTLGISLPDDIAEFRDKAQNAEAHCDLLLAESCWKQVLNIFGKELLSVRKILLMRKKIKTIRGELESYGLEIPEKYKFDQKDYTDHKEQSAIILKSSEEEVTFLEKIQQDEIERLKTEFERKHKILFIDLLFRECLNYYDGFDIASDYTNISDFVNQKYLNKSKKLKCWKDINSILNFERVQFNIFMALLLIGFLVSFVFAFKLPEDCCYGFVLLVMIAMQGGIMLFCSFRWYQTLLSGLFYMLPFMICLVRQSEFEFELIALPFAGALLTPVLRGILSWLFYIPYRLIWKRKYGDLVTWDSYID